MQNDFNEVNIKDLYEKAKTEVEVFKTLNVFKAPRANVL